MLESLCVKLLIIVENYFLIFQCCWYNLFLFILFLCIFVWKSILIQDCISAHFTQSPSLPCSSKKGVSYENLNVVAAYFLPGKVKKCSRLDPKYWVSQSWINDLTCTRLHYMASFLLKTLFIKPSDSLLPKLK